MGFAWKLLVFQALIVVALAQLDFVDISQEPTVFEATALPAYENGTLLPRYTASVGNGHVSTTVYTDTVYMNGFYNGERGESHRARIPSKNNIRISVATDDVEVTNHVFGLDVAKGVFYEKFDAKGYTVEQRTFAHRFYNKVIVTQIRFNASSSADPNGLALTMSSDSGVLSSDVNFDSTTPFNSSYVDDATYQCGRTNTLEDPKYPQPVVICVISSAVPSMFQLTPATANSKINVLAAYDFNLDDAALDFEAAAKEASGDGDLLTSHVNAWAEVWEEGRIDIEGNVELAKVVYGSLYYILSSLPVTTTTNTPARQFYGLSPGGLAYGDYLSDYQGHSFWDTETWMYPSILYLFPKQAQQILNYRLSVIAAARDRANETGYKGARYPWEGAVTGREVTPDCCEDTRDLQIHITSDISYAVRQYISTTRDIDWLRTTKPGYLTNGCTMIREMAEFYTSRAQYNTTTKLHDIRGVMPPDEDNRPVDNNPYTNIGAGYAIFFARYAECMCSGMMDPVPQEWIDIASSLTLLYDEEHDYHPEFEGYVFGTPIKQADVVLTGFPQLYAQDVSTRRNDLLIYENVTRPDGPAMTWAMHTVGFLELDEVDAAAAIFNKSYQDYMRQPYKVWTEAKPPTLGAINFITGMGGFLQSIVTGYMGYRLYPEYISFQKPRLPPNSSGFSIKGLDYLDNVFDIHLTDSIFSLTLTNSTGNFPLVLEHEGMRYDFVQVGKPMNFQYAGGPIAEIKVLTTKSTNCALPIDKIGTPLTKKMNKKH